MRHVEEGVDSNGQVNKAGGHNGCDSRQSVAKLRGVAQRTGMRRSNYRGQPVEPSRNPESCRRDDGRRNGRQSTGLLIQRSRRSNPAVPALTYPIRSMLCVVSPKSKSARWTTSLAAGLRELSVSDERRSKSVSRDQPGE